MRGRATGGRIGAVRSRLIGLAVTVTLGVVAGLFLGPPARGGVPAEAKYAGSKLCVACHQAIHAALVTNWAASDHARAMWKIGDGDPTHKVVADFWGAPFPKEQAAYVVGAGTRVQAFLDKDLKVLPVEWVVKTKSWRPRPAADAKTDCLGCHTTGYDADAGTYTEMAVGCEMCHGPGSVHAGSTDKKGTIVAVAQLDPQRQAMVCARCHSQGKSKDGKYPFAVGFKPGDDLDQSLTVTPENEIAAGSMNMQYNDLRLGGGKHLASGVVCTTCHDPHGAAVGPGSELREPLNGLCTKCHAKLTGPQHSPEALKAVTCNVCHMPADRHLFVPPKGS